MVYGRVIGNELRDVPPEFLPIWGQRWSGYRAPRGPSPFSTRIFSADRMSEVGPVLTSPAQFEMTLVEEDEGEDAVPDSSQFRSCFLSSPLSIPADVADLTPLPETPLPLPMHRSPDLPQNGLDMLQRGTGYPPLQKSTHFGTTLLPKRRSTPFQAGSLEGDITPWDTDRGIQLQTSHSHSSQFPCEQVEHTTASYSIPDWHFANTHTQSSTYPFQTNLPGDGWLSLPLWADGGTESTIAMTPDAASPCHVTSSWLTPSDQSLPRPLQDPASPPGLGLSYHLISDHHRNSTFP